MEFQSNKLIYQKEYTKRQQIIYFLISHHHEREEWAYRKISQWLNQSSILIHIGKNWFSSSFISVLKRKHQRDLMNEQLRNQYFQARFLSSRSITSFLIDYSSRINPEFKKDSTSILFNPVLYLLWRV